MSIQLQIQEGIESNRQIYKIEYQREIQGLDSSYYKQQNDIFYNEPFQQQNTATHAIQNLINEIQNATKADYHYLSNLLLKYLKKLSSYDYQSQIYIKEKYFKCFKENLLIYRIQKAIKNKFLTNLKYLLLRKNRGLQKMQQAIKYRNTNLLRKVFLQIRNLIKINKTYAVLQKQIKIKRISEFMSCLREFYRFKKRERLQKQQQLQLAESILKKNLLIKYFNNLILYKKYSKVKKRRTKIRLHQFIRKFHQDHHQMQQKVLKFLKNKQFNTKRKVFQIFKQTQIQSKCFIFYQQRIIQKYFNKWIEYNQQCTSQKYIDEQNQIILSHYLQERKPSRNSKIIIKYFHYWKSYCINEKNVKKQKLLLDEFCQKKLKLYLLKKYFQYLDINRKYERANKHYNRKLKLRSFQLFKSHLINQSLKLHRIFLFIQNRSLKKYFNRIKIFNKSQKQKIQLFLLKKYWVNFTLNITEQYWTKIQKARHYHQTLLIFKSMIAFKQNLQLIKKGSYCAYLVNIILPFKRLISSHKVRKFVQIKSQQTVKRVFFQWKLLNIRSQSNVKSRNDHFIEKQKNIIETTDNKYSPFDLQHRKILQSANSISRIGSNFNIDDQQNNLNQHEFKQYQYQQSDGIRIPTWSSATKSIDKRQAKSYKKQIRLKEQQLRQRVSPKQQRSQLQYQTKYRRQQQHEKTKKIFFQQKPFAFMLKQDDI